MSTVELWVEVFDATIDNWDKTGSTPYLDTQDMTNYVEDNDRNNDCGYFTFASSEDLGTINSVYLYIYAWAVEAADFEALINDASTGLNPPTSEGWVNAEITSMGGHQRRNASTGQKQLEKPRRLRRRIHIGKLH